MLKNREDKKNMKDYKLIFKLKNYIKSCRIYFIIGIIVTIISAVIYLPMPYLNGYIIDKIILKQKDKEKLYIFIILLAILFIIKYILDIISKNLFIKIQYTIINNIRIDMMNKIIDLPMSFLSINEKGYILSRILECENIGNLFSPSFINTILSFFEFIFSIIIMFMLNKQLTLLIIILIPIYYLTVKKSSDKLSLSTNLKLETHAILNGEIYEILNGLEEIKILNGKDYHINKLKNKLKEVVKNSIKQSKEIIVFMQNISLINQFSSILLLLFSGILIINNNLSIGIYTTFLTYMSKVFSSITSFASLNMTIKPACISIERVMEILSMEIDNINKNILPLKDTIKQIKIKELSFKYDAATDYIINNFNLDINKGDKILLKGANGTGKSTFIKIILGLYNPISGNIFINGINYSILDKKIIRNKIGVISQNVFLFRGSILENIIYGRNNKTKDDVIHLINKYHLNEYMKSFENGLDTQINQNGSGVSGGQIQIIAFLRATLEQKDILIIDEGTSNLDLNTKEIILNILKEQNICDIMIIISHQEDYYDFITKIVNFDEILIK